MTKYIQLAKKLKALADRGIGGEKINADKMLRSLMQKHNITMLDIEGEIIEHHKVILNPNYKDMFIQIASTVLGHEFGFYSNRSNRKSYHIDCTAAEYLEIKAKYDFYLPLYVESIATHKSAFIIANKLYPKASETKESNDLPSDEEMAKFRKALEMSKGIEGRAFQKQLAAKQK